MPEDEQARPPVAFSADQVKLLTAGFDLSAGDLVYVANGVMSRVHDVSRCEGQPWGCWIHAPLPSPLSDAPAYWDQGQRRAMRLCAHGALHPDPQDAAFRADQRRRGTHYVGQPVFDVFAHACCEARCCEPLPDWAQDYIDGSESP